MKAGSFAVFAPALLLASVSLAGAQQPPPSRRRAAGTAAACSGRAQRAQSARGTSAAARAISINRRTDRIGFSISVRTPRRRRSSFHAGRLFSGPVLLSMRLRLRLPSTRLLWRRRTACRWRRPICGASAKPRAVALRAANVPDMAQVYVDGYYVGLAEEFGLRRTGDGVWTPARTTSSCARRDTKR